VNRRCFRVAASAHGLAERQSERERMPRIRITSPISTAASGLIPREITIVMTMNP
jgi:hypothetical protein